MSVGAFLSVMESFSHPTPPDPARILHSNHNFNYRGVLNVRWFLTKKRGGEGHNQRCGGKKEEKLKVYRL